MDLAEPIFTSPRNQTPKDEDWKHVVKADKNLIHLKKDCNFFPCGLS